MSTLSFTQQELNHRLAQLANKETPKEKRQLLGKWISEGFKNGMNYEKRKSLEW